MGHVWTAPVGQGFFWLSAFCGRVQVMCWAVVGSFVVCQQSTHWRRAYPRSTALARLAIWSTQLDDGSLELNSLGFLVVAVAISLGLSKVKMRHS